MGFFLSLTPEHKCESVLQVMAGLVPRKDMRDLSKTSRSDAEALLLECERSFGKVMKNKEYVGRLVSFFERVKTEMPNETMLTGVGHYALEAARSLHNAT